MTAHWFSVRAVPSKEIAPAEGDWPDQFGSHDHVEHRNAAGCTFDGCLCSRLTAPRERQVFHFLVAGRTEKEAAREIGISPHTVHDYAKRVYRRFGVTSHIDLMARVLRLALGPPRDP